MGQLYVCPRPGQHWIAQPNRPTGDGCRQTIFSTPGPNVAICEQQPIPIQRAARFCLSAPNFNRPEFGQLDKYGSSFMGSGVTTNITMQVGPGSQGFYRVQVNHAP
jgi:hypothetical protein